MALGIYQVTYSDRKFCRSVGPGFASLDNSRQARTKEIWQTYQRPDKTRLELVVFQIPPPGGSGRTVNSEK